MQEWRNEKEIQIGDTDEQFHESRRDNLDTWSSHLVRKSKVSSYVKERPMEIEYQRGETIVDADK